MFLCISPFFFTQTYSIAYSSFCSTSRRIGHIYEPMTFSMGGNLRIVATTRDGEWGVGAYYVRTNGVNLVSKDTTNRTDVYIYHF